MKRIYLCVLLVVLGCAHHRNTPYVPPAPTEHELKWEQMKALEDDHREGEALAGYRMMCDDTPAYPRACYDYSRLLFDVEQLASGRKASAAFIERFPNHGLAPVAAKRLGRSFKEHEQALADQTMTDLAKKVRHKDVWDSLIYALSKYHRKHQGFAREEALLVQIAKTGRWGSQLWDNAMWRLVRIARKRSDSESEIRRLKKLIDARETSLLIASYNSPFFDDAMLRLGELYWKRGQYRKAHDVLNELEHFSSSEKRDDGFLMRARIYHEDGRADKACRKLNRLIVKFAFSNGAEEAALLKAQWDCQ